MAPVIPIIIAAAASAFTTALGITGIAAAVIKGALILGASLLLGSGGRRSSSPTAVSAAVAARTQLLREAITFRRKAVGAVVLGGKLSYYAATSNRKYHHMVITVCDGPIAGFGTVWINDEPVNPEDIDEDGMVTRGRHANKIRLKFHTGALDQAADADLIAEVDALDSNFRGRGVAYLYARVQWDRTALPNGLPNFRMVVNAQVTDPRTDVTGFNDNAVLAQRDYIIDDFLGLGVHSAQASDIDSDGFTAAANAADEIADTNAAAAIVESVDTDGDTLALTDERLPFFTGDRVRVTTTGVLPTGLAVLTDYFVIAVAHARRDSKDTQSPVRVSLATTLAAARAGTAISLTGAGSGTHTVTKDGEPRFRASGMLDTDKTPATVLEELNSAMVANLVYSGGKWTPLPGIYRAGAVEYDEDDLRGAISNPTRIARRDRFNAVKGVYASPFFDGEQNEFPPVTSSALEAADNDKRDFANFDQFFTASPSQAQRNAGIFLKRTRTGDVRFSASFSLRAMRNKGGDTVLLTNEKRGWVQKPMRVTSHALVVERRGGDVPYLTVRMGLAATESADFDWNPATDETDVAPSPRLTGTGVFDVTTPTIGTVASGTAHLFLKGDGTVVSRIFVPWTTITDELVREGGTVEVRFRQTGQGDDAWLARRQEDPTLSFVYLDPVEDGISYDIQIRAVTGLGTASDFSATTTHTVTGKTEPASNVASLSAQQNGAVVVFKWPAITDKDRAGYEIRFAARGAAYIHADATPVSDELIARGTTITTALIPPGDWTFGIKAVDTSGNSSAAAALVNLVVVNANNVVLSAQQATSWDGTLDGFVKHWTGKLMVDSTELANARDNDDVFDNYVVAPVAMASYTSGEFDLGFDADGVRVFADIDSVLGPGEAAGVADPAFAIDYRDDADSFDGFEDWTVGTVDFRHIKGRITVDTSKGLPVVNGFELVCDVADLTQKATGLTVAPGGTAVVFAQRFHTTPTVTLQADGDDLVGMKSNVTETGFTYKIFQLSTGSDVGGIGDYTATGA